MPAFRFLNRARTIAAPGYSRWLIPPAALCVHLCIGQAYAFSVFNLPMTKLLGITQPTPEDWKLTELGWIFSIAIVLLGASAAVLGRWVEEGGPRRAMFTAALFLGGRVSRFRRSASVFHNLLDHLLRIRDRRRHRTWHRLHLAGFDADQMVSGPPRSWPPAWRSWVSGVGRSSPRRSSVWLMAQFSTPTHVGVAETFIAIGPHLLVLHDGRRRDRAGPAGQTGPPPDMFHRHTRKGLITTHNVFVYEVLKTPQFWLIWWVLVPERHRRASACSAKPRR